MTGLIAPAWPVLRAWLTLTWLNMSDATPAQTLGDALPGFDRAQTHSPLQRVQHLQTAALAESHGSGNPSTVVIDATVLDLESLGAPAVLCPPADISSEYPVEDGSELRPELTQ